jgi:hypothetical protein
MAPGVGLDLEQVQQVIFPYEHPTVPLVTLKEASQQLVVVEI